MHIEDRMPSASIPDWGRKHKATLMWWPSRSFFGKPSKLSKAASLRLAGHHIKQGCPVSSSLLVGYKRADRAA